jgi:hypothetical protein
LERWTVLEIKAQLTKDPYDKEPFHKKQPTAINSGKEKGPRDNSRNPQIHHPSINGYMRSINPDREEAVLFLANVIAKKERDLIRLQMDVDPNTARASMQHMFLGMNVRNALRGAGFFYDPFTMDYIWYDWLKDAVSLPEEKVVLTDDIKMRIDKYKELMKKERKTGVNHLWASENHFITIMGLIALILFTISLALHLFA